MGTRLFVGNLDPQTSRGDLEEHFSSAGTVVSIHVPLDRETGRPRGFAFVDLADETEAERALEELDGTLLGERRLTVRHALERPARPRPRSARPSAAGDEDWEGAAEDRDGGSDYTSGRRDRRRRGGKHGSDRLRGRGTRRFVD